MTNTGKTNISTSLQFNALVHVSVYLVEQHVLCLEMERKSKPKNKTFLDYNIEMEKQVTKLVFFCEFKMQNKNYKPPNMDINVTEGKSRCSINHKIIPPFIKH